MNAPPAVAPARLFCTFVVAGRTFAIDAAAVTEVFRGRVTTTVPRGPAAIRGLLNLRGRIVPAIDMRRRLGFEADPRDEELHVVVVAGGGEAYSLLVDAIADVVEIPPGGIEPPTAAAEGATGECIEGVHAARGGLVHVLALEAILAGLSATTFERKTR